MLRSDLSESQNQRKQTIPQKSESALGLYCFQKNLRKCARGYIVFKKSQKVRLGLYFPKNLRKCFEVIFSRFRFWKVCSGLYLKNHRENWPNLTLTWYGRIGKVKQLKSKVKFLDFMPGKCFSRLNVDLCQTHSVWFVNTAPSALPKFHPPQLPKISQLDRSL